MIQTDMLRRVKGAAIEAVGSAAAICAAMFVMGIFLFLLGRDPLNTYVGILSGAFGTRFAIGETLVAATPILLCALSVSLAAWVGLLSLGAEGQLYLGAVGATYVAITMPEATTWQVLPLMIAAACACGGLWSAIPGGLRAKFGVNETIVTLLLNYVAALLVEYLIHGPWRDPGSFNWPQSPAFPPAAELPRLFGTRVHLALGFGVLLALLFWITLPRTRVGFLVRVIGANPRAATYAHYPMRRYLFMAMLISGAVAGLAGLGQVAGIEGRLRGGISAGYGYTGFLAAWLARHNPLGIIVVAVLLGALLSGADSMQISDGLPFATVNLLQGSILLFLLCSDYFLERLRGLQSLEDGT